MLITLQTRPGKCVLQDQPLASSAHTQHTPAAARLLVGTKAKSSTHFTPRSISRKSDAADGLTGEARKPLLY